VLVAESQRSWFEQVLPPDRVSVILHGVDAHFFHPVPRHASGTVRCLVVGSYLRDWKLLGEIANALRDDPSVVFDVVSSTAPRFTSPSVSVHQNISDEALRDIYQRSDILLLPLEDATANNALVEGMASGLPVIGSDLPSLREYAGTAGHFVEHHVDAFVEAIRRFARDADLRARLGCVARERAEALSWPDVAGAYEALYQRVAARGRGVFPS
jgi:glycosyltransferase involved in cell wall biosynthesis